MSGLHVVRFIQHLPSVIVIHLHHLQAQVLLLSDDHVCGVAASGMLTQVHWAWLVDGVGELVLDRGGGSSVAQLPPVNYRGGEPQVSQAASFLSIVSDREYIIVDVSLCTPTCLRSPWACIYGCCVGVGTHHHTSPGGHQGPSTYIVPKYTDTNSTVYVYTNISPCVTYVLGIP